MNEFVISEGPAVCTSAIYDVCVFAEGSTGKPGSPALKHGVAENSKTSFTQEAGAVESLPITAVRDVADDNPSSMARCGETRSHVSTTGRHLRRPNFIVCENEMNKYFRREAFSTIPDQRLTHNVPVLLPRGNQTQRVVSLHSQLKLISCASLGRFCRKRYLPHSFRTLN